MSTCLKLRALILTEDAATAVEYSVMLALIIVAVLGAVMMLGTEAGGWWGGIDANLQEDAWSN